LSAKVSHYIPLTFFLKEMYYKGAIFYKGSFEGGNGVARPATFVRPKCITAPGQNSCPLQRAYRTVHPNVQHYPSPLQWQIP